MMAARELELRIAALEAEVSRLKNRIETENPEPQDWWNTIAGSFANDPIYDEAMKPGRESRELLRPRKSKSPMRNQLPDEKIEGEE